MTVNRGLAVPVNAGVGTTPLEMRLALAGLYAENAPGVPRSGVLAQSTANLVTLSASTMSYDVGPCQLVISRAASEGVYTPTLTGTTNATTGAAPASGSRWDLIYVIQRDTGKGDTDNLPAVGVVQGASGASPTKPYASVPTGGYVLAEAQIFSGSANAAASPNTIAQVWRHTAARGAAIPVRNTAERGELTPAVNAVVQRLDFPGVSDIYDGAKWWKHGGPMHAEYTGSNVPDIPVTAPTWGPGALTLDSAASVNAGFASSPSSDRINLPAGLYEVQWRFTMSVANTGTCWGTITNDGNTNTFASTDVASGNATGTVTRQSLNLTAQQNIRFVFYSNTASGYTLSSRITVFKKA